MSSAHEHSAIHSHTESVPGCMVMHKFLPVITKFVGPYWFMEIITTTGYSFSIDVDRVAGLCLAAC